MTRRFHPLRINEIRPETEDSVSIAFDVPPELTDTFAFQPGQFLTFRIRDDNDKPVDRSYSICSTPADADLRVLVKRLDGGVFGERAHTVMVVGDRLDTLAPLGRFTTELHPENDKSYLAIAAGSGISPVMCLVRSILNTEPKSHVTVLYGNRGSGSIIFRDALSDLKNRHLTRLQLFHVFSREPQHAELLNGRLTDDKVRSFGNQLIDLPSYDEAFICGPQPMTLELRATLIDVGIPTNRVHVELYGTHNTVPAPSHAPTRLGATMADAVELTVSVDGIRRAITGHRDQTLLDAARTAGLDVPFSCTGGVCATCRARIDGGSADMAANYSLQQWELDAGFVLTCQARPTTTTVSVDYDAV